MLGRVQRAQEDLQRHRVGAQLEPQRLRGKARGGEIERDDVHLCVIGQAPALVGEDGVGDADLAERQRHPQRVAAVEQAHDLGVGLALGLGVEVAVERGHQRTPALEVEFAHLIRSSKVHVDRALMDGRVSARRLGRAEQLAG